MYYIISKNKIGQRNGESVAITTEPGKTNMSHEIRLDGWLGTTNDIAYYAHGEYETIEAAESALDELFPERREAGVNDYPDPSTVQEWIVGEYEEWSADSSIEYCYDYRRDIDAETTDAEIEKWVDEADDYCREDNGGTLDVDAVVQWLIEYRNELI
jgi:hypothetical protein